MFCAVVRTLGVLHLFFRREIPAGYDLGKLKDPAEAIRDRQTFNAGWLVLVLLLSGFFVLEPLGVSIILTATAVAVIL